MKYKLPNLEIINRKSKEDRIIIYRKFFADLRLNRLDFHILLLKFLVNPNILNQNNFISEINSYFEFMENISIWINKFKKKEEYNEFIEQGKDEILAMENIVQSYKKRMNRE